MGYKASIELISEETLALIGAETPSAKIFPRGISDENWQKLARCAQSQALALLPYEIAKEKKVLPLSIHNSSGGEPFLNILAGKDLSPQLLCELRFICGLEVVYDTISVEIVELAIEAAYRGRNATSVSSGIPQLLDSVLCRASYLNASDIHFEPFPNRPMQLRFRVHGSLRVEHDFKFSANIAGDLIRRIKILSQLDITVTDKAQEGAFTFNFAERHYRVRVSFVPQMQGQKAVLRMLEQSCEKNLSYDFSQLGLLDQQQKILLSSLACNSGAILLAGPTGSGKSTLLYAALNCLNQEWRNIITMEDPVERQIQGITQLEASACNGKSYRELLKVVLRQDPDVLMIGEIREKDTADTVLTAAITGHLVLSTLHAGNCFEIFLRLAQLGVDTLLQATSLRLLVAQRLLPLNCENCRVPILAPRSFATVFRIEENISLAESKGCELCQGTGIQGRVGVFELLSITPRIKEALFDADDFRNNTQLHLRQLKKIRAIALDEGFFPLVSGVRQALISGTVSPQSALRTLGLG